MVDISSPQQFVNILADNRDSLIVVKFYASWCAACKGLYPKFAKLAKSRPDVLFVKMNYDDHRQLAKQLGVKVLPYFQFYRGAEGRVAAFAAGSSRFPRVVEAIEEHGAPRCSLGLPSLPGLPELQVQSDGPSGVVHTGEVPAVGSNVVASGRLPKHEAGAAPMA